jgi:hypothetical protein
MRAHWRLDEEAGGEAWWGCACRLDEEAKAGLMRRSAAARLWKRLADQRRCAHGGGQETSGSALVEEAGRQAAGLSLLKRKEEQVA